MLENLTKRLDSVLKNVRGKGLLTEENIDEALKEVRLALLEADVHFKIVKTFNESVRAKAVGKEVLESLSRTTGREGRLGRADQPDGRKGVGISLAAQPPTLIMLVGLQGSGKQPPLESWPGFIRDKGKGSFSLRLTFSGRRRWINFRFWGKILKCRLRLPIRKRSGRCHHESRRARKRAGV